MFSNTLSSFVVLLTTLVSLNAACPTTCSTSGSSSTPPSNAVTNTNSTSTNTNSTSSGGAGSGPHFVIYSDNYVSGTAPPVDSLKGYTVFALSFLLSTGAADQALGWQQLDSATRQKIKSEYNAAGIKLVVSAFGATETPTTAGADAAGTATKMAAWVKQYGLDGIDVDYEDLAAMNAGDGKAEAWLETFTKTLRGQLPQGQFLLTHAPLAPWFSPQKWGGGGYLKVDKDVGSMIDWYNIQFYNQGAQEYTSCAGLLTQSSSTWPKSSVFEIASSGVSLNKLVIGKPGTVKDATNGVMDTTTLAGCLQQAKAKNWSAGAMVWQYPNADATWIKNVRAESWPVQ